MKALETVLKRSLAILVLGMASWSGSSLPAEAQTAPCQYILGFATLHGLDPSDIGDCLDNQAFASNGDAQQHTTKGLMAWRKADNWTAFTNGYMTWINGPSGLVHRLNTERFPWEADYSSGGSAGSSGVQSWQHAPISASAIPLGDGKVSTTPQAGYIDSCMTSFRGGGAFRDGPWINQAAGTWDATSKVAVQGANLWPNASHSFTLQGSSRELQTNDLPQGQPTGNFPISPTDPASQYDRNPNQVAPQAINWTVPAAPADAPSPTCLGMGAIGVTVDGAVIFNGLDDGGRDAGAHEVQDSCDGHPQMMGEYHYHTFSPCLMTSASSAAGSSTLIGYALDGYGIYLERDAQGNLPTDADLDACHGRTSTITWDGASTSMYHYDVTLEYPYTLGCYHGVPAASPPGR